MAQINQDYLVETFLQNTFAYSDMLRRIRLLREYLTNKLFSLAKLPADIYQDDTMWLTALDKKFIEAFNQQNLQQMLDDMEKTLKSLPFLIIYLPFELPNHEMIRLGKYLRSQYGKNFLMDIKFDSDLIAGCSLVWNGIYKDYSTKKQLENKKSEILSFFGQSIKHA